VHLFCHAAHAAKQVSLFSAKDNSGDQFQTLSKGADTPLF